MDTHRRARCGRLAAAALVAALALAGCSSDDSDDADDTTTTEATEQSSTTEADGGSASTEGEGTEVTGRGAIELAETDLGEILVQGGGLTIYLTLADTTSESTCVDACAEAWPPLTGDVEVGEGVDESLLGTTTRPDGTEQITYNGHPLYLFAADTEPGMTEGQGVGDVWYVVDAEGNPVED